jgi:hypothetical protein
MITALSALIGLVAGIHAATWGMYKDAPHEGFSWRKYARSPVLGTALGPVVTAATELNPTHAGAAVVLFGVVYAFERALAEIYKTFLRNEDQSKYFIPMQFHILGRVIQSRLARLLVGALYTILLIAVIAFVAYLDRKSPGGHSIAIVLVVGSLGGWISAFGGAWKDAPSEGFQTLKFFRSPALAAVFAWGLAGLTDTLLLITLAATGYTVATTETYKTFFFPSKPRGKFAGKPIRYPEMLVLRRRFVLPYAAIWAGLLMVALEAARVSIKAVLLATLGIAVAGGMSVNLAAQEAASDLRGISIGASMDRFIYDGIGETAFTFRRSDLRPGTMGTELSVSLLPRALAAQALVLLPDFGPAYNVSLSRATLLIKAGGSAITGLARDVVFVPGAHVGAGFVLRIDERTGIRVDAAHHWYMNPEDTDPVWSIGIGFTGLPRH